jgi:hypothetical protein
MSRKPYTIHYIYKIINILNNKFYVGMHSTFNLNDNYFGSGKLLKYSINKYGKENHIKEILEYCDTREELKNREKEIVNKEFLMHPLCMNLAEGGEGGGLGLSFEQRSINSRNGYDTFKNKLKNDLQLTEKYDAIYRENGVRLNKSKNVKTWKQTYDRTGTSHSIETKEKIRNTRFKLKLGIGKNNSQFGTCWIYNNIENKKIKKENLDYYLSLGWRKGRKLNCIFDAEHC